MPRLAFPLFQAFVAVAFVWRSWLQWRRTGDTGIRALARSSSPSERGARLLLGVACLLIFTTTYAAWFRPPPLAAPASVHVAGLLAALGGIALTVLAQLQMGRSWRIGLDRSERTDLIRHGLYAHVRNPIYSAMLLASLGLVLLAPGPLAITAWAMLWAGLELQVRAVEEPHLASVHGDAYRSYCRDVGRFVPRVGRTSSIRRARRARRSGSSAGARPPGR